MIIHSLKLKNIRSYSDETIVFPEGSIMLSGDIGSGKTSILLGIEFALFGIIRGYVTGSSLLRHGKQEGFVELEFTVQNQRVIIRRSLKRGKSGIGQESGYLVINAVQQDLSPVELKSKILELIGYPDELLTKSKSFIFRYTVYTPQEEMKHILLESKDERLNVLRRIFDIDKYKRIRENTMIYLKDLRNKRTELETRIEDLEAKKTESAGYNEKIAELKARAEEMQKSIAKITAEFKEKEAEAKSFEEKIKSAQQLKSQAQVKQAELEQLKRRCERDDHDVKSLNNNIERLSLELEGKELPDDSALKKKKHELEETIRKVRENIEKISDRESSFRTVRKNSEDVIKKINSINECPVCLQVVDENHKHSVHEREMQKTAGLQAQLDKLSELKIQRKKDLESGEKDLRSISEQISSQQVLKLKKEQLTEYLARKERIMKEQSNSASAVEKLLREIAELKEKAEGFSEHQIDYEHARKALEEIRQRQKLEEIKKAELEQEQKTLEEFRKKLDDEIKKKEESKKKLVQISDLQNWLMKYFLNIIYVMEKQIMLRVHREFNEHFQEWFNILIEDESLNVSLDETFTPTIEQNGYETYLENLSGGERTSVALAYRLALNKVINDFIGTIKTKDLLILDEPTDGFSSEQLDKIRELLEAVKIKQIILVSHEPKLESYVDHIIRVYKAEHQSRVIQ